MATLSTSLLTMYDWAKRLDPDGKVSDIAELLSETNDIWSDVVMKEGNLPTGEQVTIRTGLPTAYYRMINSGTPATHSTTAQVTEQAAILESRCHVDQDEAELNGNVSEYRMSEGEAHLEAMSQKQSTTLFYGSASNPEEYVGLANRYSDVTAGNADNIIDAGGSGSDNTSIWFIGWSPQTVYGIFPKGSKVGLYHEDLGLDDVEDASGNMFRAYKDLYKWKMGLAVKDWRYAVRIGSIDVSDLSTRANTQTTTASTNVIFAMSRAIDRLPKLSGVKAAFYCNRTVASYLRIMALEKSTSAVTIEPGLNQFGQNIHQLMFLGHPVRINDAIVNTEALV